jgi:integrase
MALTEPIRNPAQVRAFLSFYRKKGQFRNQVLVAMALHTALRISDVLNVRCEDVYDFSRRRVLNTITIVEKKTGKHKIVALHKTLIKALRAYFPYAKQGEPLIKNTRTGNSVSRIQAYRLIREAALAVGVPHKIGCHSLRKTFGYHSWVDGTSPVILMEIYNHSNYAVTKRYLGISQDEKNTAYHALAF